MSVAALEVVAEAAASPAGPWLSTTVIIFLPTILAAIITLYYFETKTKDQS
jgi:hypothetical protein